MSPGRKPSRSPASTAGRDRIRRSTSALFEQRHRVADREPGLAGAGRAFGEHQLVLAQRRQIAVLGGVARAHDAALAGLDLAERVAGGLELAGEQRALVGGLLDRAFDVAFVGRLAELGALVEQFEHAPRLLARLARAANDDLVAVGVGADAEPALDAGDVLVVVAEDDRGQTVVVEGEGDLGRFRLAGLRRGRGGSRQRLVLSFQTGCLRLKRSEPRRMTPARQSARSANSRRGRRFRRSPWRRFGSRRPRRAPIAYRASGRRFDRGAAPACRTARRAGGRRGRG